MPKKKTPIPHHDPVTDHLAVVGYLSNILDGARQNSLSIDTQLNILVGFSTALFLFSVSRLHNSVYDVAFLIAAVMSAASSIIALVAVHPPRFATKRGQTESLMYNREIIAFKNSHDYAAALAKTLKHGHDVHEQYAIEIYNLYKFYYRPKRRLFHVARNILLFGVTLSAFAFLVILTAR